MSAHSQSVPKKRTHLLRILMKPHPHCMDWVMTAVEETE
jgi:hypothetical protein